VFTSGDQPDIHGIERAIAGVFSMARHPTRRNRKRGMEGTPGRVYLDGGCIPHLLASKICKGSHCHIGRIKRLAELTGTKDRVRQVLVVESVLRDMVDRGDLWYSGDSWFASKAFLSRQKQFSDALRARSKQLVVADVVTQRQAWSSVPELENA